MNKGGGASLIVFATVLYILTQPSIGAVSETQVLQILNLPTDLSTTQIESKMTILSELVSYQNLSSNVSNLLIQYFQQQELSTSFKMNGINSLTIQVQ